MNITEVIPLMILPNATLFPEALLPLHILSLDTAGCYRMFWTHIAYFVWL